MEASHRLRGAHGQALSILEASAFSISISQHDVGVGLRASAPKAPGVFAGRTRL